MKKHFKSRIKRVFLFLFAKLGLVVFFFPPLIPYIPCSSSTVLFRIMRFFLVFREVSFLLKH